MLFWKNELKRERGGGFPPKSLWDPFGGPGRGNGTGGAFGGPGRGNGDGSAFCGPGRGNGAGGTKNARICNPANMYNDFLPL